MDAAFTDCTHHHLLHDRDTPSIDGEGIAPIVLSDDPPRSINPRSICTCSVTLQLHVEGAGTGCIAAAGSSRARSVTRQAWANGVGGVGVCECAAAEVTVVSNGPREVDCDVK